MTSSAQVIGEVCLVKLLSLWVGPGKLAVSPSVFRLADLDNRRYGMCAFAFLYLHLLFTSTFKGVAIKPYGMVN